MDNENHKKTWNNSPNLFYGVHGGDHSSYFNGIVSFINCNEYCFVSEDLNFEKRIAITPEIAKKFIENGFDLFLPNNYANI